MDDAEGGVTVLDRVGDESERDEIVDLVDVDPLAPQLLMDAEESFDATVDLHNGHLGSCQLRADGPLEVLDHPLVGPAAAFDLRPQ